MRKLLNYFNPVVQFSNFLVKNEIFVVKKSIRNLSISKFVEQKIKPGWGSKKSNRQVKLQLLEVQKMADPKIEETLAPFRQSVKEQVI